MADLNLTSQPLVKDLPIKMGGLRVSLLNTPLISAIKPMPARKHALYVDQGQFKDTDHGRVIWAGLDLILLMGDPPFDEKLNIFEVSDAWVFMALEGEEAYEVMARLSPIDLRASKIAVGQCFRTQLGHIPALILCVENGFEIGVSSSFAQTARDEIVEVVQTIVAIG